MRNSRCAGTPEPSLFASVTRTFLQIGRLNFDSSTNDLLIFVMTNYLLSKSLALFTVSKKKLRSFLYLMKYTCNLICRHDKQLMTSCSYWPVSFGLYEFPPTSIIFIGHCAEITIFPNNHSLFFWSNLYFLQSLIWNSAMGSSLHI